jgi:hypothetical protein
LKIRNLENLARYLDVPSGDLNEDGSINPHVSLLSLEMPNSSARSTSSRVGHSPCSLDEPLIPQAKEVNDNLSSGCPRGTIEKGVCRPYNEHCDRWMEAFADVRELKIHEANFRDPQWRI